MLLRSYAEAAFLAAAGARSRPHLFELTFAAALALIGLSSVANVAAWNGVVAIGKADVGDP